MQNANRQSMTPSIPLIELAEQRTSTILPFIAQPLLQPRNREVYGFEVLYRGVKGDNSWLRIDESMLIYLSQHKLNATLFVNLSNDTVLGIDSGLLFSAAAKNTIYFEWSESVSSEEVFRQVIARINDWSQQGLSFVIDDFGAGRDGFERLFSIDKVAAIKFDGSFFRMASQNPFARKLVSHIILECANKQIMTVGECVETSDEFRLAESLGVDLVQGFYVDALYHAAVTLKKIKSAC